MIRVCVCERWREAAHTLSFPLVNTRTFEVGSVLEYWKIFQNFDQIKLLFSPLISVPVPQVHLAWLGVYPTTIKKKGTKHTIPVYYTQSLPTFVSRLLLGMNNRPGGAAPKTGPSQIRANDSLHGVHPICATSSELISPKSPFTIQRCDKVKILSCTIVNLIESFLTSTLTWADIAL